MPETGIFWDRILFSAKESIYKAWFQYQRAWLGFEDAVVQFDPERGSFSVRLRDDIPSSAQFSAALRGRFAIDDGIVVTVASLSSDR